MLTKKDLNQLREIIREELEPVKANVADVKNETNMATLRFSNFSSKLSTLQSVVNKNSVATRFIKEKVRKIDKLEKLVTKIKKDTKFIISYFDEATLKIKAEISRVKEFVNMPF